MKTLILLSIMFFSFPIFAEIRMERIADSRNDGSGSEWVFYNTAFDTYITFPGSTTQGLQEVINYCVENGLNFTLEGGCVKSDGQDPSIVQCTTAIIWPPLQKGTFTFNSVTINFAKIGGYGMLFDSIMAASIIFNGGQIVAPYCHVAVAFQPRTLLPNDTQARAVITASTIILPSVICDNYCVSMDTTNGTIRGNPLFRFTEINGGQYGLVVSAPANGFIENNVEIIGAHDQSVVSIQIGTTASDIIYYNFWKITASPSGTGGVGVMTYGDKDKFDVNITNQEGQPLVGFILQASSEGNKVTIMGNDAVIPVQDFGVNNSIR